MNVGVYLTDFEEETYLGAQQASSLDQPLCCSSSKTPRIDFRAICLVETPTISKKGTVGGEELGETGTTLGACRRVERS